MQSFWYHQPEASHPPPLVHRPEDVRGADRLAIAPWQPGLSPSEQRALVREWCTFLPSLQAVRLLWLTGRTSQALFDAACQVGGLEGLWVKASSVKTLAAVPSALTLRHLYLGSSPALESLEPLGSCGHFSSLGLENVKRISELDPLATMETLRELSVSGSTWTTQRVETLEPIGHLTELRYLSLVNLRAADGTLRPLFTLRKLKVFHSATWWDPTEVQRLRELNPRLKT